MWWCLEVGPLGGSSFMRVEPLNNQPESQFSPSPPGGDTRWPSTNQQAGSHRTQNLPAPWSWTSQLLELWEISVCCVVLSHPVLFFSPCSFFVEGCHFICYNYPWDGPGQGEEAGCEFRPERVLKPSAEGARPGTAARWRALHRLPRMGNSGRPR